MKIRKPSTYEDHRSLKHVCPKKSDSELSRKRNSKPVSYEFITHSDHSYVFDSHDQTIQLLKVGMESTVELSSEQSKLLQTYVEELKVQISKSDCSYKILYDTFIELTKRQDAQLKKYENIVEVMDTRLQISKDTLKKVSDAHARCPSIEEYDRLLNCNTSMSKTLGENEKLIYSLRKQLSQGETERKSLEARLNRELKTQKELLDRIKLLESEIGRFTNQVKQLMINETAVKECHKRETTSLNNKIQLMAQQIDLGKQAENSLEAKNKDLLKRLSKLNEEIYFSREKEKGFKETICCLEQQLNDKDEQAQFEIEKYIKEISCLRDKLTELEYAVASRTQSLYICEDRCSGDAKTNYPVDISYNSNQTEVLKTIAEKMTKEQTKCHSLVDKIHGLRMEFVKTQEEITHLRKTSGNKRLIHEKMVYENRLTHEITLAEGEWRRSIAQSRALLNTLCMINKTDLPKDTIMDHSIT